MSVVKKQFVHLHCHSDYSLLDGACKISKKEGDPGDRADTLVARARKLGMNSVALTDHGNMFGAIEFYSNCMKQGVKPIVGIEAYIAPASRFDKTGSYKGQEETFNHLTILCKNETGYKNLMLLSSLSYTEGFYYKPRMDKELLAKHHEGLIALSGCPNSEFGKACKKKDFDAAIKVASELSDIFGKDNFYLEIQNHGLDIELPIIEGALRASRALNLKLVATNDVHYLNKEHYKAHDVLLAINTGTTIFDENRLKYGSAEFYLKSPDEMYKTFDPDLHIALENTLHVDEKCNLEIRFDELHLPKYHVDQMSPSEYLRDLCYKGLKRYSEVTPEVKHRLEYELSTIEKMGFASYFLIVYDFVRFARENSIIVGPGRGSAAGSIIAYLLGITDIDPLRYGLIFERFLNPERRELPDIDMDFAPEQRQQVIEYVKSRYGHQNVSQIITFTIMKARLVIRDVCRAMGIDLKTADMIAKRIPMSQIIQVTLEKTLDEDRDLKAIVEQDPKLKEMVDVAVILEGLKRHCSKHAGGIVITDRPTTNYTPIFVSRENEETTQYDMNGLQSLGLLKMDILGVETLSILDRSMNLIYKQTGKKLTLETIPLDDAKTYEMLSKGLVRGVFQLEGSRSAKDLIKGIKPDRIEDILAAVALNRPGPMQSGMTRNYIEVKHGRQKPDYLHPSLEPILKETNGAILYQEQVMMIANKLAGFTMAEADKLRKAMGKKIRELMQEYEDKFVQGAVKNKVSKEVAASIFEKISYFAGYGFNKSHSAAYGLISYYTAYLKANYPVEFMTVLFSANISKPEKLAEYIDECKKIEIETLPPNINESEFDFTVNESKIRFGLGVIKNIGPKAIEAILLARKENGGAFKSFQEFCELIPHGVVDKRAVEQLIKCGAFDTLGQKRKALLESYSEVLRVSEAERKQKSIGQLGLFGGSGDKETIVEDEIEFSDEELLKYEKEALGVWIRSNPMEKYEIVSEFLSTTTVDGLNDYQERESRINAVGIISNIRHKLIHSGPRRGAHYALVRIQDMTGTTEGILFPASREKNMDHLKDDNIVFVRASLEQRDENKSLIIHELIPIDVALENHIEVVVIKVIQDQVEADCLDHVKELLRNNKGTVRVMLEIKSQSDEKITVGLSQEFSVKPSNELAQELYKLVGRDHFKFILKKWNGK